MADVKTLGYKIGLHTSGYYPENFAAALPLTDWVGLDIKAPFGERYEQLTRTRGVADRVRQSLAALLASGKDYQLRLTFDPAFHHADDEVIINQMLGEHGAHPLTVQTLNKNLLL
ncbi:MAG: anaerobic ribonucleoside-triphosphate reductase activating protein, partial [Verrucomicrobiales bacterium]|jgi:pyruvate formate lyase activating enzyme|nr:anaerobic ribonucleoside-triphosphate reductase activating protein [Verrucomicrobiales bacterium]